MPFDQSEPTAITLPAPTSEPDEALPRLTEANPQDFYAEITEREDVRRILEELADG